MYKYTLFFVYTYIYVYNIFVRFLRHMHTHIWSCMVMYKKEVCIIVATNVITVQVCLNLAGAILEHRVSQWYFQSILWEFVLSTHQVPTLTHPQRRGMNGIDDIHASICACVYTIFKTLMHFALYTSMVAFTSSRVDRSSSRAERTPPPRRPQPLPCPLQPQRAALRPPAALAHRHRFPLGSVGVWWGYIGHALILDAILMHVSDAVLEQHNKHFCAYVCTQVVHTIWRLRRHKVDKSAISNRSGK